VDYLHIFTKATNQNQPWTGKSKTILGFRNFQLALTAARPKRVQTSGSAFSKPGSPFSGRAARF
jgi:hypothetical protein